MYTDRKKKLILYGLAAVLVLFIGFGTGRLKGRQEAKQQIESVQTSESTMDPISSESEDSEAGIVNSDITDESEQIQKTDETGDNASAADQPLVLQIEDNTEEVATNEQGTTITASSDKTLDVMAARTSSLSEPLSLGSWGLTGAWVNNEQYEEVAVRLLQVVRGDVAEAIALSSQDQDPFGFAQDPLAEGLEYVAIKYEVYVPEDTVSSVSGVRMYIADVSGEWIDTSMYDDFGVMLDIATVNPESMSPGETKRFTAWYTMDARYVYAIRVGDPNLDEDTFAWYLLDETPDPVEEPAQPAEPAAPTQEETPKEEAPAEVETTQESAPEVAPAEGQPTESQPEA